MWIANLAVVLTVGGCAAYQYLKGTLVKSFASIITAICASVAAFGYFELLAGVFIGRSGNSRYPDIVPWAQPLSLALLFIVAFAVLQTILTQLTRKPVDLGLAAERIGRVVCGIFLGLIVSGVLLSALAMAPLESKYPYPRFDERRPDPQRASKVLFNADGLATGWFNVISNGSLSGKASFATLHPDFLDQAFLNRHVAGIPIITSSDAIELPRKKPGEAKVRAAWPAPAGLKDSKEQPIAAKSGHTLTIVRVGIKRSSLKEAGRFTPGQLRLICKEKGYGKDPLAGKAQNVWPAGYLEAAGKLRTTRLDDEIRINSPDFEGKATVRYIDFAFYVPSDSAPVLIQFKQNTMLSVPAPVGADEAPEPVFFVPATDAKKK